MLPCYVASHRQGLGVETQWLQVEAEQRPYLCMDLSFCYTLLSQGFKVPEDAEITVVKRIKYKANEVEAAWPLGAAINLLSSTP